LWTICTSSIVCGHETGSLTLKGQYQFQVFQKYSQKYLDQDESWGYIIMKDFNNLYSSASTYRIMI
jgi:hypothetical protein